MTPSDHHETDERLDALVHSADLDGLIRMIDDRCAAEDWAGLLRVRDRARAAVKTGRQLWPAATLAEYRLALWAPASYVGLVLDESDATSGQFTIGPLTEVAAQRHTWAELRDELDVGPRATFLAHERVIRGEVVDDEDLAPVLDIPTELQPWEPRYVVATYADDGADFGSPTLPDDWSEIECDGNAEMLDDEVAAAARQLVEPWLSGSNGRADAVCVEGDVTDAIGALGVRRARIADLTTREALAWVAWVGASGGAHGRRRGAAAGRFGAWWLVGALGDMLEDWPADHDEIGELANDLDWYRWDAFEPVMGWSLQLAVEDVDEGVAWAITATDAS